MELRKRVPLQELEYRDPDTTLISIGEPSRKRRKPEDKDDSTDYDSEPVAVKRSRNTGKLARLLEMPIEIFTEVACHLSPEDLLSLARTSIRLRKFLMSKLSKRIWQTVLNAYHSDIPPCPSDLSEPQYAVLLFGKCCDFCGAKRADNVLVSIRARLCANCTSEKLVSTKDIVLTKQKIQPCSILPSVELEMHSAGRTSIESFVIAQHLQDMKQILAILSLDKEALQAYVAERGKLLEAFKDSSTAILQWLFGERKRQEDHKEQLEDARRKCIEDKLLALGYDEEDLNPDYDPSGCKWNKLVKQTRPLSDRVWQNIRPQLEVIIKQRRVYARGELHHMRRRRRTNEMKEHFTKFKDQLVMLPFGRLFSTDELFKFQLVKRLIEQDRCTVRVTDERWIRVANALPRFVTEQTKEFEKTCVKWIIEESMPTFEEDKDTTSLRSLRREVRSQLDMCDDEDDIPKCLLAATAFFGRAERALSYQQILHLRSLQCATLEICSRLNGLEPSRKVISMAEKLLVYLNLPRNTSMSYMQACGKVFRCSSCTRINRTKSMGWRGLVEHFVKHSDRLPAKSLWPPGFPLRDDHDLENPNLTLITRVAKTTVDMQPTFEPAGRYSALSASWGLPQKNRSAEESVTDDSDGETAEDGDEIPLESPICPLCWNLSWYHAEDDRRGMRKHMRLCHGTDLNGEFLPGA